MRNPKHDIISEVSCAAMHLLHESCLSGSDLWPMNGVVVGLHYGDFIDGKIYVTAFFRPEETDIDWRQRLSVDIHSRDLTRVKEQARVIDLIFDSATHSDVGFAIFNQSEAATQFRYHAGGLGSGENHYINLKFTYTTHTP